jgi:hypothetical protein
MFCESITFSPWFHPISYYVIVTSHRDYPCEKKILGYNMGRGGGHTGQTVSLWPPFHPRMLQQDNLHDPINPNPWATKIWVQERHKCYVQFLRQSLPFSTPDIPILRFVTGVCIYIYIYIYIYITYIHAYMHPCIVQASLVNVNYSLLILTLLKNFFLSLHRAFWRFTYYHVPTNALIISFII